jgi:archaemetzincin
MAAVAPLHTRARPPEWGEWLSVYPEPGQTFAQYLASHPVVPDAKRRVLYVQPLGPFTAVQRDVVAATAEFLQSAFALPVTVREALPLSLVPRAARRKLPWTDEQIQTDFVRREILRPHLPADAVAMIAFTAQDLWPGSNSRMNYVFGDASLRDRVGVWSLHRLSDQSDRKTNNLLLLRTLKIASHETAHMLSLLHCTQYECDMAGSNGLYETDHHPLAFCPECMAKLCWATRQDPRDYYRHLAAFCRSHGLTKEADFYGASLAAILKERSP